jgi:DNA (cytosine-5)-methyltransferase 1
MRERLWVLASNNLQKRVQGIRPKTLQGKHGIPWCEDVRGIEDLRERPDIPEPLIRGIRNGVAYYVDRIAAIGNGQVPAVAALAFKTLNYDYE